MDRITELEGLLAQSQDALSKERGEHSYTRWLLKDTQKELDDKKEVEAKQWLDFIKLISKVSSIDADDYSSEELNDMRVNLWVMFQTHPDLQRRSF